MSLVQSTGVHRSTAGLHQFRNGFARSFVLAVCQGTLEENEFGNTCGKSVAKQKHIGPILSSESSTTLLVTTRFVHLSVSV